MSGSRAAASEQDAVEKVREGVSRFREGKLDEAARLFQEADVALPEDETIAFDRAAALHAKGDAEGARPLYLVAASARDPALAARALGNLGTLAAGRARAVLGDAPEDAPPEKRQEAVAALEEAIRHLRACLERDPGNEDARYNLELIRVWLKHMTAVWQEKDRAKRREELSLIPFLEMLIETQRGLRAAVRGLEKEEDSPLRREAVREAAGAERELAAEVEPLEEKIADALEDVQDEAPRKALEAAADAAGKAMAGAADDLSGGLLARAREGQARALAELERIFDAVAPFEKVLERAMALEAGVVDGTGREAERTEAAALECEPLAEDQGRVKALAPLLARKAEAEPPPPPAAAGQPGEEQPQPGEAERETAKKKAIELAPRIEDVAGQAAADLAAAKPKDALPKEEEALRLLKEIAESLPKQEQQQQDEKKEDEKKEQQEQQQQHGQQDEPKPQDMTREQAEALIRKAKEREREHRERTREHERALGGSSEVDRDW